MNRRGYVPGVSIHAAAQKVPFQTTPRNRPPTWWGIGQARLAPVDFAPPVDVWSREAAMSVPTIRRARDLICGSIAALPLTLWRVRWDPDRQVQVEEQTPPAGWMMRPDPDRTRQYMLAWHAAA